MPFTFAHPSIVIPLKRIWGNRFNLTALVFGSMAPDFEYFSRMKTVTTISHTPAGIFIFDLPLVIVLSLVFQWVIRNPLLLHLPSPLDRMFSGVKNVEWRIDSLKRLFIFVYSSLIGIVSHLVWDSFTHKNGAMVEQISSLKQVQNVLGYQIPIYKFLQHGSTLLGFIIIALFLITCPKLEQSKDTYKEVTERNKIRYWIIVIVAALVVVAMRLELMNQAFNLQLVGTFIVTLISGLMIGLIIASITSNVWTKI